MNVEAILAEADEHRNATAVLSRSFKSHVGLKRELDATVRELQSRVDRFVRHSGEETFQLSSALNQIAAELADLKTHVGELRLACADAQRLCDDARLKRDRLINTLKEIRHETARTTAGMSTYMSRTQLNASALEQRLLVLNSELEELLRERARLYDAQIPNSKCRHCGCREVHTLLALCV